MTEQEIPGTLANHLERLAIDADDVAAMLQAHHADGGDIHPEALDKAARLQTSLRDVIHALTHHEHLALDADDVWATLTREHKGHNGTIG